MKFIIGFIKVIKMIFNFSNNSTINISNNSLIIKNNYGVEKEIVLLYSVTDIYFIPIIYKKGVYKLKELPCLIYSKEEFENLSFTEKQRLFEKYSFWYKRDENILSNYFSNLYDENKIGIDNIEVSYIDLEGKTGMLNRISFPNSKNFFQFFEKDIEKLRGIINKITSDAVNSILEYIEKEVNKNEEIFRMFIEYYGDGQEIDIVFTLGTTKDYNNILEKYTKQEYLESFGLNLEETKEYLKDSSGDYVKKFSIVDTDEIQSYYCSFAECGITFKGPHAIDDKFNNFPYLIVLLIKKVLEKKLDNFNLGDDFKIIGPMIYD